MHAFRYALVAGLVATAACAPADEQDVEPIEDAAPQQPAAVAQPVADTTAEALWAHLQSEDYRSWPLFPGKGELYSGTEPHGMLLTTYVNPLAHDALTNGAAQLPAGAVIVKENYMPDSTFAAATVMHKVPGYDPQNGDWYWAKYDPNGVVEDAGRVTMCAQCHGTSARDHVMTPVAGN